MEKFNVILVLLNEKSLGAALKNLNFGKAKLVAVVVENGTGKFLNIGNLRIPIISFANINNLLSAGKNFVWLIGGFQNGYGDLYKTKKFLVNSGVPEDNIVNFDMMMTPEFFANLRYVEKFGATAFATGISYAEVGIHANFIPMIRGSLINLASSNSDLRQGYLTAKYVFEHVKPGTIKFVLIGLAPYSLRYDNAKSFSVCPRNLQYMLALNLPARNRHDKLLLALVSDNVKNFFANVRAEQADLNYSRTKTNNNRELPAKAVIDWEAELKNLTKKLFPDTVEDNMQILKDYIKLCLDNGAKPVGVVLPFAPIMRQNFSKELLTLFRLAIRQLEESYEFMCVDLFDLNLGYDCFYNMAHLNLRGAAISSALLGLRLYEKNLIPTENFCGMNYEYFNLLSNILPKKNYNALMSRVFQSSAQMIRRKDKIRVGFVGYDSSMWCGDKLYSYFANDERFEPTIFLCLRTDKLDDELVQKDFLRGVEQFKSHGFNVVGISEPNTKIPAQDVLIFLTPYFNVLPRAFQLRSLTARTLLTYIPYGFQLTTLKLYNKPTYLLCWKLFFESKYRINLAERECRMGMSRGIFSGYPKLDTLFEDRAKLKFNWKMSRRKSKKIIYAPHWSINGGVKYATFQHNYKFMYEFAKAHPEISWVVKPHPNLLFSAVETGVFPTRKAFEEYLQAWNDLPNAQVYTGAYYHEIFATSDGMIHDSSSFIGEYQYAQKPMIFLTRDTQEFNEMGEAILNVSYTVDGRDLNGIAALMQKIFIAGEDPKRAERQKFFDEHLNYYKQNGMSASEFIYRNISRELEG